MPLAEQRQALNGANAIQRILALDSLWTATLQWSRVGDGARSDLAQIGREMQELLHLLRQESKFFLSVIAEKPDAVENYASTAVDLADSVVMDRLQIGALLREEFQGRSWVQHLEAAFLALQESYERHPVTREDVGRAAYVPQLAWSFLDGIRWHYAAGTPAEVQRVGWTANPRWA